MRRVASTATLENGASTDGIIIFKVRDTFVPGKLIYKSVRDYLEIPIINR